MDKNIITRVKQEAEYIIKTKKTIREIASIFNVSKSTVHKDLQERLKLISIQTEKDVKKILNNHLNTRHLKGGEKTKEKYAKKIRT